MYNNPYMPTAYNPQMNIDRLNEQINNLEKLKAQMQQPIQQPTNLTQNFQLAPNNNRDTIRYANSMEEVSKENVMGETPYFSKDMSVVWIKDIKGNIKTYELTEIIAKDDKDLKIEYLQAQIEELKKGMIKDEPDAVIDEPITESVKSKKSSSVSTISKTNKKSK